jgi:hypothetical protein
MLSNAALSAMLEKEVLCFRSIHAHTTSVCLVLTTLSVSFSPLLPPTPTHHPPSSPQPPSTHPPPTLPSLSPPSPPPSPSPSRTLPCTIPFLDQDVPVTRRNLHRAAVRLCFMRTLIAVSKSVSLQNTLAALSTSDTPESDQKPEMKPTQSVPLASSLLPPIRNGTVQKAVGSNGTVQSPVGSFNSGGQASAAPVSAIQGSAADKQAQIIALMQQLIPLLQSQAPGAIAPLLQSVVAPTISTTMPRPSVGAPQSSVGAPPSSVGAPTPAAYLLGPGPDA